MRIKFNFYFKKISKNYKSVKIYNLCQRYYKNSKIYMTLLFNNLCLAPSNFSQVRNYSTDNKIIATNNEIYQFKLLNPWYITGFCDAEGCFSIIFQKRENFNLGWQVRAEFSIHLHNKDTKLLKEFQNFFNGVGSIVNRKDSVVYYVTKLSDLINVIIPHFDKYNLQSAKLIDYTLWRQCIYLMVVKEHLTLKGLEKFISIKGAINNGLPDRLIEAFPGVVPMVRPTYLPNKIPLNPQWVSGFTEGDGSFYVSVKNTGQISAVYSIGLNIRDKLLLEKIKEFFEVGRISNKSSRNAIFYEVSGITDLNSIIVNHFNTFSLVGAKFPNYLIFREIVYLLASKSHLTPEGRIKIMSLKENLNK